MDDNEIIQKAFQENWILITNDKDFGDQIYREHKSHHGVILLLLDNERAKNKIDVLKQLLNSYADRLPDQFVVATEEKVRFAKQ